MDRVIVGPWSAERPITRRERRRGWLGRHRIDPRDALLALKQVSINFAPGTNQAEAQRKATEFATAMSQARGCGVVEAIAGPLGAQVVTNDQVKARDLPVPL